VGELAKIGTRGVPDIQEKKGKSCKSDKKAKNSTK